MAHVTGPTSTLPGYRRLPPVGTACDDHPAVKATVRLQGETDSMGAEWHDLCAECAGRLKAQAAEDRTGVCDWCRSQASDLKHHRDMDEGRSGRVYQVCGECRCKESEAARDELADSDDWYDGWI